jgi:hypothetical protein
MNRFSRRIEDLLAGLVLENEAGICDAVCGDEACLLLLSEVFERAEEWMERRPTFAARLLRACLSASSDLPRLCTRREVPEAVRIRFVQSMRTMLVAASALESAGDAIREPVFMWWDGFAIGDRVGRDAEAVRTVYDSLPMEVRRMADVELQVLRSLLESDSRLCCESALHGLNHLLHPDSANTVADFMEQRKTWLLQEELLHYAVRCRDAIEL